MSSSSIDYQTTIFSLKPDAFGANQAVLLHARTDQTLKKFYRAILYIHGYSDYFFQDHVCARFLAEGYDFYALDLRKCGRAIISPAQDQYRHYCRNFDEYNEELTLAIEHIIEQSGEKSRKILLLGHSTGGLISIIYGQNGARRDAIDAIILNSPYLSELELSVKDQFLINMLIQFNLSQDSEDLWYGRTIHQSERGEWNFDLKKKPIDKLRLHGAFFAAIRSVHQAIQRGEYHLSCPILMMCSDRSMKATRPWQDEYHHVDLLLNVRSMKQAASLIGSNITIQEIVGGKHDLFLSNESSREKAFEFMFRWLEHLNNDWMKTTTI